MATGIAGYPLRGLTLHGVLAEMYVPIAREMGMNKRDVEQVIACLPALEQFDSSYSEEAYLRRCRDFIEQGLVDTLCARRVADRWQDCEGVLH